MAEPLQNRVTNLAAHVSYRSGGEDIGFHNDEFGVRYGETWKDQSFCRTATNKCRKSSWRVSRARKTNLRSPKSFDVTARGAFMLLTDFFAIEVWLKKPRRKRF